MRIAAVSMFLALWCAGTSPVAAEVSACGCDPAKPETLQPRECSLCKEAEKQPAGATVFFLKDVNPRKTNRMLALPKEHSPLAHSLKDLSPAVRSALWTGAIERARSLWGDQWGLALNGDEVRTQCHAHIHIGKLIEDLETARAIVVDTPAQIPAPEDGSGMWVHPAGDKLHVHFGEQITETVLLR